QTLPLFRSYLQIESHLAGSPIRLICTLASTCRGRTLSRHQWSRYMRTRIPEWAASSLPLAITLARASGTTQAASWLLNGVDVQLDSQLSLGASWSTTNPDRRFIHTDTQVDGRPMYGQATARTSDDGRLNFKRGDVFSQIFKGSHDLELRYGNSGGFFRGMYWYDFETKDRGQRFYDIDDSGRHPLQKGSGVTLLDAF